MAVPDNDNKWNLLQAKLNETKVTKAFEVFEDSGIEPVLIKGYASARFYPPEVGRAYVDVDLAVPPNEFQKAEELIKSTPLEGANIDLHKGFRHLDTVSWDRLFANTEVLELNDTKIRLLCPEDHLRILCVHWLTDGGENKERLWDIYYAVDRRPEEFSWEKCLGVVSENRQRWIKYTIGLAHKFLDLDISDLPFKDEAKKLPGWLPVEVKKNWDANNPIVPLNHCLHDRKKLWKQIKKRIPPNPIFSTVYMDGDLDSRTRVFYQIGNFATRFAAVIRTAIGKKFRSGKVK
ncbi:MAG: hypothetical protein HKN25_07625 [Pyrinomonadaceae bacterium]|nr:hypothetical protein [Pyrinomonadaceae bacterium]